SVALLLLLGLIKYVFNFMFFDADILIMMAPFLMMAYVYLRYIFSGIEFTEVASKGAYHKQRRASGKRSLLAGLLFFLIQLLINGLPANPDEKLDLIALPIIFTIFYFLFDFISLKRSYRKNKDLTDDE